MNEQRIWRWAALACVTLGMTMLFVRTAPSATAHGVRVAPATSVAVINLGQVLEALNERTVREDELKREIDTRQSALDMLAEQAEQVMASLETIPTDSPERVGKVEEAVRIQATLEFERNLATRLIARQRTEMQLVLFNKIKAAAKAYADTEGFDVVLTTDDGAEIPNGMGANETNAAILSRRVLHASQGVNITSAVAQRMNNEFNR
ncbi:MAG: OmpH family outer membrane protein [Planctomycetota bacterium]